MIWANYQIPWLECNLGTHILNFFIAGVPTKIMVSLKGDAKKAQLTLQGYYILQLNNVNGKPYYLQKSGLNGLWFENTYQKWMIGPSTKLGENFGSLQSAGKILGGPIEATGWRYWDTKTTTWFDATSQVILSEGIWLIDN